MRDIGYFLALLCSCLLTVAPLAACSQAGAASEPSPRTKIEMTLAAVGDVMMPASIQKAVAGPDHRYTELFERVAPDLSAADITFANLETQVDHLAPAAGYPRFNAGPELLLALKQAGVGIVSVANNHALDAGPDGLLRTLDNVEAAGLLFIGAGRTRADRDRILYTHTRGITTAFLAYTYGTNRGVQNSKPGMPAVNILRADSEDDLALAAACVHKARQSADLVVVSLHWSEEYRTRPTAWQRRAAGALVEAGADIILGHHPHVIQPVESFVAKGGRTALVAFSLGNFISSQNSGISNRNRTDKKALRGDGIVLTLFVEKENGTTRITRAEFLPLWTLRERGKTVVYRTISIDREISRLRTTRKRTREDEGTLQLLAYRKKAILDAVLRKR